MPLLRLLSPYLCGFSVSSTTIGSTATVSHITHVPAARSEAVHQKTLPQLPIEIWHLFIDYLYSWGCSDDLKACSLVCRTWASRSRFLLARNLRLSGHTTMMQLVRKMQSGLHGCAPFQVEFVRLGDPNAETLLHLMSFAATFGGHFVGLTHLELNGVWPELMHPDLYIHLSSFSSVTRLDLRTVTLPNVSTFGRLVGALPNLVHLTCRQTTIIQRIGDDDYGVHHTKFALFRTRPLRLLHFEFDLGFWNWRIITFMIRAGWNIGLRDVRLMISGHFFKSNIPCLVPFLAGIGSSLRTLSLVVLDVPSRNVISDIDLSTNTRLETVAIRSHILLKGDEDMEYYWMEHLLSQVKSQAIREVVISVDSDQDDDPAFGREESGRWLRAFEGDIDMAAPTSSALRCVAIEAALMLPQFERLERIVIEYRFGLEFEADIGITEARWSNLMRIRFPRLYERGILHPRVAMNMGYPVRRK